MDSTQAPKPVQHLNIQAAEPFINQGIQKFSNAIYARHNAILQLVKPYIAKQDFNAIIANCKVECSNNTKALLGDWNTFKAKYQILLDKGDFPSEGYIKESQSLYEKLFVGLNQGVEAIFERIQVSLGEGVPTKIRGECQRIAESTDHIDEVKSVFKRLQVVTQNVLFQPEGVKVLAAEEKSQLIEVLTKNFDQVREIFVRSGNFLIDIYNKHSVEFNEMQLDEHENQLKGVQLQFILNLRQHTNTVTTFLKETLESARGMSNKTHLLELMQQSLKIRHQFKKDVKELQKWCQDQYNFYIKVLTNKEKMSEEGLQMIINQYEQSVKNIAENYKQLHEITSTLVTVLADHIFSKDDTKAAAAGKVSFAEAAKVADFHYQKPAEAVGEDFYEEAVILEGGVTRDNNQEYVKSQDRKDAYIKWKESDGKVLSPKKRNSIALESGGGGAK